MNLKHFLFIGALALGSQAHAADLQGQKIFDTINQGMEHQQEVIKDQTQNLYKNIFSALKAKGLTTLNMEDIPLSVGFESISPGETGTGHLKFKAFADDLPNGQEGIRVVYNSKGQIAPPVTSWGKDFAQKNQHNLNVPDGNYLEFTILHELAHLQHDKMGYMNPEVTKNMSSSEKDFIEKQKSKEYMQSLDGKHNEQTADVTAAVWYSLIKDDLQDAVKTIQSFKENRDNDSIEIKKHKDDSYIGYDTANGLNSVLNNIDKIRNLNNQQALDAASKISSEITLNDAKDMMKKEDAKVKYAFNMGNLNSMRDSNSTTLGQKMKMK